MTGVSDSPFERRPRVDAYDKVRGRALYAADYFNPRMVHAALARATIARGRITSIDTAAAAAVKGVLLVLTHENIGEIASPGYVFGGGTAYQSFQPLATNEIAYRGQPVAVIAAETLEAAIEAAGLVTARYETVPFVPTIDAEEAQIVNQADTPIGGFFPDPAWGNADAAFAAAPHKVEGIFFSPTQHQNPLELIATVAEWEGDRLTIREGSQYAGGIRVGVAKQLGIDPSKVRVVSPYVGGGFGQKNSMQTQTVFAAIAARRLGRPVKLVVPRSQVFHDSSFRSANRHLIKLAANDTGRFVAAIHEATAQTSRHDYMPAVYTDLTAHQYAYENYRGIDRLTQLDTQTPGFMRAPWEHPASFALDCAVDELAYRLGKDPVELRLMNDTQTDRLTGRPHSSRHLAECLRIGRDRFGWSRRSMQPGSMRADDGTLIGWGVGTGNYPGYSMPAFARVTVSDDGRATVSSSVHEMGQGARAALAAAVERMLRIPQERVTILIGDTDSAPQLLTAGSWGVAGTIPAVEEACTALLASLEALGHGAVGSRQPAEILRAAGRSSLSAEVRRKAPGQADDALNTLQQGLLSYTGPRYPDFVTYSYSAHFVEVRVEPNTRRVRVPRVISVADCGRVVSPVTAASQVRGGVTWGIGAALREISETDPRYGGFLNADIAEYVIPVNADIGQIEVFFVDQPDTTFNASGVKGLGEVSMTGVAAALANAIFHATGKRVRHLPIRIEDLL
jgi:xanthine dehydrogenase YagR molybdenum-binding subunit